MNLQEITNSLQSVSDVYAQKFSIKRDRDWFLLKLQEELGELTAAHLKLTERGRLQNQTQEELKQNLADEIADVIAMTLLLARNQGIDVDRALANKWFKYLDSNSENK